MSRRPLAFSAMLATIAVAGWTLGPQEARVTTGAEQSPSTVRAVGLMINHPIGTDEGTFTELAFQGTFDRTALVLKLNHPAGGIVELRREDSTLSLFADDRGTDLIDPEDAFGPFDMNSRVAEDRRSLVFQVGSERLPDPRAAALSVAGEVVLLAAQETTVDTGEAIELGEGSTTTVGPWTFEVSAAGPSEWSEGYALTLVTHEDPAAIVRWALVDADGTQIELRQSMSMSGAGEWQMTLEAERSAERAALRVEHWIDPQFVRVPFELEVGLGF